MTNPLRLLCLLLVLLVALPAMQARACTPDVRHGEAVSAHHGYGTHHTPPAPVEARHDCLGCVAPIDVQAYRPAAALNPGFDLSAPGGETAFPAGLSAPPEPPPPRLAV